MFDRYPQIQSNEKKNPAINLFGNRFFDAQAPLELLAEFFILLTAPKRYDQSDDYDIFGYLPSMEVLREISEKSQLHYETQTKLNLKLFSFLSSCQLSSRHNVHIMRCKELWNCLKEKMNFDDDDDKNKTLDLLSNLFLGFWGTGANRAWSAQSFLPFCEGVLANEAIWGEKRGKEVKDWEEAKAKFKTSQKLFYARGGEVLYLQLCNALRQDKVTIHKWLEDTGRIDYLTDDEQNPENLHKKLCEDFNKFFKQTPEMFNKLANMIEGLAQSSINEQDTRDKHDCECDWCAAESWREGYLFAVELHRILNANIGIMETVDMLQIACALQEMRTLAAQSTRAMSNYSRGDGLDYCLLVSDPEAQNERLRDKSQKLLQEMTLKIYSAVRLSDIQKISSKKTNDLDSRYGHKLYIKTGKILGLIVPKKGARPRIVMTDKLLRYFVLSMIPGKRMTLDSFLLQIESFHGLVFDENHLKKDSMYYRPIPYLEQMLEASGVLVKLSDSCSLVENPFNVEA